ncbi:MAG: serine/threonine protein kinase [Gemmatimonadetes bacterium]|nr:serine/threonine protein kinase [Gemmatimonadota bacterium]
MTTPPSSGDLAEAQIHERLAKALGAQYEVRGMLGRGGFAEVFEVWDKSLERRLAVKVLRPDVAWTSGMLARFKQEAKAVAQLAHPNILPIHFVGEGEGIIYYAMPYIEGKSLGDVLRTEGRLTPDRALAIARSIFDALEHAHQKGLIHRDIKPDNIMIDQTSGRPMLVDFGIAKRMEGGKGLTQTGFVVGTPHYMSPEQALGQGDLDPRSDIYAMGAVLFQMVTGTPPFDGDTSQEIVAQHITKQPPLASEVDGHIPQWLSDVIVRCMAKRPADRFDSALHASQALTAGRKSGPQQPVSAERVARAVDDERTAVIPTAERRASRPVEKPYVPPDASGAAPARRSKLPAVLALIALLALAGAGAFFYLNRASVLVENRLVEPIQLTAGSERHTIDAGGQLTFPLKAGVGEVRWVLIRPTTPQGIAMGREIGGTLPTAGQRGTSRLTVDGMSVEPPAFAPLITNETKGSLAITVNAGLSGATSCNCWIPAGATRARIGYYPLYQNSTVRAEDQSGRAAGFGDLGPDVDQTTGSVGLRFQEKDFRK